ncbi:serine/threonine-protein kinase [Streptomyces sp. NPDC046727]|uniref:serine/threonine-protein kinase n=1 Tax=Streptomyces sp. NPDC046727 TaxID=3155373 RepID=UPI0033CECAD2
MGNTAMDGPPRPEIGGWVIERELGRGGMGVVHAVVHSGDGRRRALKLIRPDMSAGLPEPADEWIVQFEREIAVHQGVRHPHVVRVEEVGNEAGLPYLVMELCEGGSLGDRVGADGPLPVGEAVPLFLDVLRAVHHIHTVRGTVHRDIKPHNILLSRGPDGAPVAKLSDFGLAKAFETAGLSGLTRSGVFAGTIRFMPMEQVVRYKYAKPPVDVWACAASLYFVLTGRAPRDSDGPTRRSRAVPVRERDAQIPERLAQVLDQALDERSGERPRTAEQLGEALRAAV